MQKSSAGRGNLGEGDGQTGRRADGHGHTGKQAHGQTGTGRQANGQADTGKRANGQTGTGRRVIPTNSDGARVKQSYVTWLLHALGPLAYFFLQINNPSEQLRLLDVAALFFWTISWWLFERVPTWVASLIPLVLLFRGQVPFELVTKNYFGDIVGLFFGGFVLARSLEVVGLHEVWARRLLRWVRGPRNGLLLLMSFTAFLSMWISNSAAAMLMLPFVGLVLPGLHQKQRGLAYLAVAYAASIGGLGTLVGSPPNPLTAAQIERMGLTRPSFLEWMIWALPFLVPALLILWAFIVLVGFRNLPSKKSFSSEAIFREQKKLRGYRSVQIIFLGMVLGWGVLPFFGVKDAWVALGGAALLLMVPKPESSWKTLSGLPFGILLLFGGSLLLSDVALKHGLSEMMRDFVATVSWEPWLVLATVIAAGIALTELASNTAAAALFLPVVGAAQFEGLSPIQLMLAVCLSTSLSFMLPTATPPNAVAFAMGKVKLGRMLWIGMILNLIFGALIFVYIKYVFPLVSGFLR